MGLVQKSFSDIITFSRSSNATRVGPTGVLEYAPHNLLTYSEQFDNAAWTKFDVTVTSNVTTAPNGTVTADLLYPSTSGTYRGIFNNTSGVSGQQYTASFYIKSAGFQWVSLATAAGGNIGVYFDVINGVKGTESIGTGTITSVGNGWYRCTITSTASSGTVYAGVTIVDANNSITATASGTSGIYLWGAQLSVGPYPLDYTPTTSAAVYGPRFDYDPVTLAARGLLVEEQRTNLLTYSEQFDNAAWAGATTAGSVSANATTSPDGTVNADLFIPDTSSSATHRAIQFTSTSSGTFSVSVYAKAAGYSRFFVFAGGANQSALFDLTTQTVVADTRFAAAPSNMTITAIGNGWYRCLFSTNISAAVTNVQITVLNSTANPGDSWTGNGTSGLYIWGAQLEAGSFATSYIPTLASTVTRSADVASVNTLSPWFNASTGTLYAESVSYNNLPRAFSIINTGSADIIGIGSSGTNLSRLYIETGGITQANLSVAYTGSTAKEAAAYAANDAIHCVNGTLSSQDTSVSLPTLNKVDIGYFPPVAAFHNGWIRRLAYYPRRLTNAELQALTA